METVADPVLEDTLFSFDSGHSLGGSFVAEKSTAAGDGAHPLTTPHRSPRLSFLCTANFSSVSGFDAAASTPSDDSATSPAHTIAGCTASPGADSPPSGLTRAIFEYPSDMVLLPPVRRPSHQAQTQMRRDPPTNRSFIVQPL